MRRSVMKMARVARVVRLLRLLKMRRVVTDINNKLSSEYLTVVFAIAFRQCTNHLCDGAHNYLYPRGYESSLNGLNLHHVGPASADRSEGSETICNEHFRLVFICWTILLICGLKRSQEGLGGI